MKNLVQHLTQKILKMEKIRIQQGRKFFKVLSQQELNLMSVKILKVANAMLKMNWKKQLRQL